MPTPTERSIPNRTIRRPGVAAAVAVCLLASLIAPVAAIGAELEVPSPPEGGWVDASLALLAYNRERCDRLANKILVFWRSLPPEAGRQVAENQKQIRERVIKEWLAELTEARTASDIVATFKPRALESVDAETAVVLDRLHTLQSRLCDQVAYPAGPMAGFVDRVTDVLLQIDTEARQLDVLLPVDQPTLDRAIAPYLETLQLAGVEAEGEMLHFLERPASSETVLTAEALMAVWFERYQMAAEPAKDGLRLYIEARDSGDREKLRTSCETMASGSSSILDAAGIFHLPDEDMERQLRRGYLHLQRLAAACLSGNFTRADRMLRRAEHHFAVTAAYLERFGYDP